MYGLVYGQVEIYWSSLHSELVDRYEISISQMTMAVFPLLSLLPMKVVADGFIKQELLVLLVNFYSPLLRLRSVLLIFFILLCCVSLMFLRCVCLRPVFLCVSCCRCLWIVHSWLLLSVFCVALCVCVFLFFVFFCLLPVSYVPHVAGVSGLFFLDCPIRFP